LICNHLYWAGHLWCLLSTEHTSLGTSLKLFMVRVVGVGGRVEPEGHDDRA
jgi:hypothetical protein